MIASSAPPAASKESTLPMDLGHWVHGKALMVCLTPTVGGQISVYIAVPASAMPHPSRYGAHINYGEDSDLHYFLPGELVVDVDTNTLRGNRVASHYCTSYRVGFSLDLEPRMTADVANAVRRCNTLARVMASQQES